MLKPTHSTDCSTFIIVIISSIIITTTYHQGLLEKAK
jgi:hypothetical protein